MQAPACWTEEEGERGEEREGERDGGGGSEKTSGGEREEGTSLGTNLSNMDLDTYIIYVHIRTNMDLDTYIIYITFGVYLPYPYIFCTCIITCIWCR